MPASGSGDLIAAETSQSKENLRIGDVEVATNRNKLAIKASSRYKPENESEYETDRWGYTETEMKPIMEFVGLDTKQQALIREFIPIAVDEAGGFAGFRETATKTKSVIDRVENIVLPDLDSVEDEFDMYLRNKEKTDNLRWKIEQLDKNLSKLLYHLYNLSEKDIHVLNSFLSDD